MKKILFLSLIIIAHWQISSAQCNADELGSACIPKLSAGFNFVKAYKINGAANINKVEYSYVFTKGTQYMVTLCEQIANSNAITVTIFDGSRNKVASNKIDGTLLSAIAYPCNATGIYYLQYTFEGTDSRCGGSVLGFKR